MKIDRNNPRHWLLLLQQGLFTMIAICLRPFLKHSKRPLVLLYGHQPTGNLQALQQAWRQHFRTDLDVRFLCLNPAHAAILRQAGFPALRCDRLADMLRLGRASAIISDHGLHALTPLLYLTDILFIDVWHGIPFKGFTPEDFRTQRRYDECWVSSRLLAEIYARNFGFKADRVRPIGYARTDRLFRGDAHDNGFRAGFGVPRGDRIVLYAPTWQQDDRRRQMFPFEENADEFLRRLNALCASHAATLVVRSHLNATIGERQYSKTIFCPMERFPDTEALLLQTDVLLCDWSSIAFDFLALKRPTIFIDVAPPFQHGFTLGPEYRFGSIASSMDELEAALSAALAAPERFMAEHAPAYERVTADVYDNNTDGRVALRQLTRLIELVKAT